MEQGAPAAIVLAASFTTAGRIAFHRNGLVIEATGDWCVRGAPAHIENLRARVRIWLARRTVRARNRRRISDWLGHRSMAKIMVAISSSKNSSAHDREDPPTILLSVERLSGH
jgi:hypothetical protein